MKGQFNYTKQLLFENDLTIVDFLLISYADKIIFGKIANQYQKTELPWLYVTDAWRDKDYLLWPESIKLQDIEKHDMKCQNLV